MSVKAETVVALVRAGMLNGTPVPRICAVLDVTREDLAAAWKKVDAPRKRVRPSNISIMPGFKWCAECRTVKPLDDFGKNAARPDGVQAYCRVCWPSYREARAT